MNSLSRRICLGLVFFTSAKLFDLIVKPHVPDNEFGALVYFGVAASVDWMMFYTCRYFVDGNLSRGVEAICIASVIINGLGLSLYMAESPPLPYPDFYIWAIQGINYALAFLLLFMGDGNVLHHLDRFNWRAVVRRAFMGYQNHAAKEKKS